MSAAASEAARYEQITASCSARSADRALRPARARRAVAPLFLLFVVM
jgi:hypothetical protein